jgi:hypothetical protein
VVAVLAGNVALDSQQDSMIASRHDSNEPSAICGLWSVGPDHDPEDRAEFFKSSTMIASVFSR